MPITLGYNSTTDLISPLRIGNDQTIIASADQLDVPILNRSIAQHWSARRSQVRQVIKANWYTGLLRIPWIDDAELPNYQEMRISCFGAGETLTIDATGHRGIGKTIEVIITGDAMEIPRWQMLRDYRTQIPYAVINRSYP